MLLLKDTHASSPELHDDLVAQPGLPGASRAVGLEFSLL